MIVYKNEVYNVDKKLQKSVSYSPINMQIDLTHTCNSNCLFCLQGSSEQRKDQMETETVFELLKELKSMGCYRVGFSGGEPFLREDILEILQFASKLGFSLSLTSNGQLIEDTDIMVLSKISLARITISLHAVEQNAYNFIFGTNKYNVNDILKTIATMIESNICVGVAITLTKYNIDSVPNIIEKILDIGVDMSNITFNPLLPGKKDIEGCEPSQGQLKNFFEYWGAEAAKAQLRYADKEENDRSIYRDVFESIDGCRLMKSYGLNINELRPWPMDFPQRLFDPRFRDVFSNQLTSEEIEKIKINMENM
jgi:molybdenum cofactor biosynthesis enzyme MoaA